MHVVSGFDWHVGKDLLDVALALLNALRKCFKFIRLVVLDIWNLLLLITRLLVLGHPYLVRNRLDIIEVHLLLMLL